MKRLAILILTIVAFATTAYAHNGMIHVMGSVTAVSSASVTVKSADGKVQTVSLTDATKYMKGNAVGTMKDIKVGEHVVIHATKKGDTLIAAEVKIGMMDMKGMPGDMSGMKMNSPTSPSPH